MEQFCKKNKQKIRIFFRIRKKGVFGGKIHKNRGRILLQKSLYFTHFCGMIKETYWDNMFMKET